MYLVSHFLNEEFLLPYWLRHHVTMFDHGVLIDYGSTDRSVDIIRDLAPHWEIRKTKVEKFEEPAIGDEVQEIEEEFPDGAWKMVLNITEFLLCGDLRKFVGDFELEFPNLPGFRTNGVVMVDSVEEQFLPLTDQPLVIQRCHGIVERRGQQNPICYAKYGGWSPQRCRFIHKMSRGQYCNGRHLTMVQSFLRAIDRKFGSDYSWWDTIPKSVPEWVRDSWDGIHPEIFTCWFGRFSPFESIKSRVAALDFRVPRRSFITGETPSSPNDTSLLEQELEVIRSKSCDLRGIPAYCRHLGGR